jgi:hypothetical protein
VCRFKVMKCYPDGRKFDRLPDPDAVDRTVWARFARRLRRCTDRQRRADIRLLRALQDSSVLAELNSNLSQIVRLSRSRCSLPCDPHLTKARSRAATVCRTDGPPSCRCSDSDTAWDITAASDGTHVSCEKIGISYQPSVQCAAVYGLSASMGTIVTRRLIVGASIVAALPFAICSVTWAHAILDASLSQHPWVHITLEAFLNVLWLSLALGTLVYWLTGGSTRSPSNRTGLVSLIFVIALLFPVVSASDDIAEMALINDAATSQSIIANLEHGTQLIGAVDGPGCLMTPTPELSSCFSVSFELFSETSFAAGAETPRHATGNHSPPF